MYAYNVMKVIKIQTRNKFMFLIIVVEYYSLMGYKNESKNRKIIAGRNERTLPTYSMHKKLASIVSQKEYKDVEQSC